MCFPKLILSSLPRGGVRKRKQNVRTVRDRLELWTLGAYQRLCECVKVDNTLTDMGRSSSSMDVPEEKNYAGQC